MHELSNDLSENTDNSDDSGMNNYFIDTVSHTTSPALDRAFDASLTQVVCVNIFPKHKFESLNAKIPLEVPDSKINLIFRRLYSSNRKVTLACMYRHSQVNAVFYIVNNNAPPLDGLQTSVDLGLIKLTYDVYCDNNKYMTKESMLSEYGDLFKGVGIIPGKSKLHLSDDAVPVITAPRRIPEAIRSRLKLELEQMVKDEIISPVTEPTDWVHPIVVVEKPNNKLRICLDPERLNDYSKTALRNIYT